MRHSTNTQNHMRLFVGLMVTTLSGQTQPLTKRIDDYLAPFVEGKNFIGDVLVARGDDVLFHRAYGQANYSLGVPNAAKTRFHIASISKPFTTARPAVTPLASAGLEDPGSPDHERDLTRRSIVVPGHGDGGV